MFGRTGAHGRTCTDTLRILSALSLRWTTWAKWCRVRDFHPQPLRSERSVSCSWTNAALKSDVRGRERDRAFLVTRCPAHVTFKMVLPAGLSPATATFEASHSGN